MAREAPTMQKVADSVGVSVSTVSRILNSPDFAKPETRDNVIAAAHKLGYRGLSRREGSLHRDGVSGSLKSKRTRKQIVLLAPDQLFGGVKSPDWIFRDVIPTLQRLGREKGFQLLLSSYSHDDFPDIAALSSDKVFGVLCLANGQEQAFMERIAQSVPFVFINDDASWPPRASVMSNNRMVMFKAVEHLARLGHRRIGYFDADESPRKISVHSRERLGAYREALAYFDLDTETDLFIQERFGFNEHPQAVCRAMDRIEGLSSRLTALIAPLGYSIQFLKETRKRSIRIPEDMSLLAIDNAPVAEMVDPSLTVVDCCFAECTEAALDLLMDQAQQGRMNAKTILYEPKLVIRNSTAAISKTS
jgi:LacI family transcriptional regulator